MAVVLMRQPFSKAERELIVEAIMSGAEVEGLPELDGIALTIAEQLPDLLKKARLPDTSQNRRGLIHLVLVRWSRPKTARPSRSYRRFRR